MTNYAVAETKYEPGHYAANLTDEEIEYKGVKLPPCPPELFREFDTNVVQINGKTRINSVAEAIIAAYKDRTWTLVVFVDLRTYMAAKRLMGQSIHLRDLYSKVRFAGFKDPHGDHI